MLKDYRRHDDYSYQLAIVKAHRKDFRLVNEAWDLFSDYIGIHSLKTPLTHNQFNDIFEEINKQEDGKFTDLKKDILKSFMYDSYNWPLVEREGQVK